MKKVLIIAYYWPPAGGGGVQRWVKFVKYLRDFGWEPIVYVPQNPDYPYYDQELCNDIPQGIEVLKGPIIEPNQVLNFFKKDAQKHNNYLAQGKKNTFLQKCMVFIRANFFIPDARMLWIKPSVKRLSRYLKENHVDVLISTGPPHSCHLIGLELHKQSKIPWIADFRDAWSQIEHFDEMMLSSRSKAHHLALEKQVLDTASCVTTVGYYLAQDLSKISDNNIHVIRNGFDPSDFKHLESQYDDNRFTISYIGSMLFSQNPDVLWTALTLLYQENFDFASKLQLNMIGTLDKVVHDTILTSPFSKSTHFEHYVPHSKAIQYQLSADILILAINKSVNNKQIVTGKVYEYLAAKRPILCIGPLDGEIALILKDVPNAAIFDYEDIDGVKDFISDVFNKKTSNDLSSNTNEQFSRIALTKQLSELMHSLRN